jgi:hypothetical protein
MKKLSLLLVIFSLGLFALGCEKSETDVVVPDSTPTTPAIEDDMTDVETDIDVTAPDATIPDATAPDAAAPDAGLEGDATAPDAAAPEGDAAAPGTEG